MNVGLLLALGLTVTALVGLTVVLVASLVTA